MTDRLKNKRIRLTMALVGAAALALSVVMTVHSYTGMGLVGCSAASSCGSVLGSVWSIVLGIVPVSLAAVGVYAVLLVCIPFSGGRDESTAGIAWVVLLAFSGAAAGSAVYFTLLQILVIGSLCKYCCAAHLCGILEAVLALCLSRRELVRKRIPVFVAGLLAAGALAVFQSVTVDRSGYVEGRTQDSIPDLLEEGFPVLGDPGAATVVELLYDYQCDHCRKVHASAVEMEREHHGDVAFVLCPCPLSPSCNPYIPSGVDRFEGSCDYARLALAVWHLAPERFFRFDSYLWTLPDLEDAYAAAADIAGSGELAAFLASDSVFMDFSSVFEVFGRTLDSDRAGLPRLVCGQSWIIPESEDPESLFKAVSEAFSSTAD